MPGTDTHEACAGRVALVTGAARGIGQAIAFGLAKREAAVIIGGIEDLTETGELIARTGKAAVAAAPDISDPSSVAEVRKGAADEPGRVDILVSNAAIFESTTWGSRSPARYRSLTVPARWASSDSPEPLPQLWAMTGSRLTPCFHRSPAQRWPKGPAGGGRRREPQPPGHPPVPAGPWTRTGLPSSAAR